jgi:hypothetical protein
VATGSKDGTVRIWGSESGREPLAIQTADGIPKAWKFDAVADQTTLEIYTLEKTDPFAGPALDNVRVVAVAAMK